MPVRRSGDCSINTKNPCPSLFSKTLQKKHMRFDWHLFTIITIMIFCGGFGGLLNFLHKFDTGEETTQKSHALKFILLGIGAALLVPVFLKMIQSTLADGRTNSDYLVFAGFCLIAAIFSRRFITSIGERILEAAKQAEKTAQEAKEQTESTSMELSNTRERIEDVKLAVDLKGTEFGVRGMQAMDTGQRDLLVELAESYVERTSVAGYQQRLKMKAELGRKMGEMIVRNNFSKDELLQASRSEGMLLGLAYSVQLRPSGGGWSILQDVATKATQLYTKYAILLAVDTLTRNNFVQATDVPEAARLVNSLRQKADAPLLRKIDESLFLLEVVDPSARPYKMQAAVVRSLPRRHEGGKESTDRKRNNDAQRRITDLCPLLSVSSFVV
jgi:hypothetical protein